MSEKAMYYRQDGSQVGPWPAGGQWPTIYGNRGFYLQPPREMAQHFCAVEGCEQHQDNPEASGFSTDGEFALHCREMHGAEVWRRVGDGEIEYRELETESEPSYQELQEQAKERGLPYVGVKKADLVASLAE